jgi:monomeric sarcosine oxidase
MVMIIDRADLVIIGAGLAGSAAAWSASARGLSVVVLEARAAGHRLGSSHGSARIFRKAYADPLYVRMTGRALDLWHQLENEAGESLLQVTGGLNFGRADDPHRMHSVLTACEAAAELLGPGEAAERWPGISFDGLGPVLFQPDAGVIDPERAMAAMLRLAVSRGARVLDNTPAARVSQGAAGGIVHTEAGTFAAPVVVVAAGGWLEPLMGDLIRLPPLRVTQQHVFHFAPRASGEAAPWPVFVYQDENEDFYGLPGGRDGEVPGAVKLGEHYRGTLTTADGRDGVVAEDARRRASAFVSLRLPGLNSQPVNEFTCLYTWTPSEDFILDRQGPFVIASACSGHGAKFAPLLGEIAADLAAGIPSPDLRFTLARQLS